MIDILYPISISALNNSRIITVYSWFHSSISCYIHIAPMQLVFYPKLINGLVNPVIYNHKYIRKVIISHRQNSELMTDHIAYILDTFLRTLRPTYGTNVPSEKFIHLLIGIIESDPKFKNHEQGQNILMNRLYNKYLSYEHKPIMPVEQNLVRWFRFV